MPISPLTRQFMVAGTTHLAALSAGGVIAFPSVLLQQLQANDTIVELNLHNGSWIGSVHGLAGIPSILLPLLMQYRGRKLAFILSSFFILMGWISAYLAQNITTLIISECFHGLGANSLLAVSFLSVTEMIQPKYRHICLLLYGTVQAFGISLVGIIGRFMHWKTVGLIMCVPVSLALLLGSAWPESPSWLACKGKIVECEKAFERLRGTDEESKNELKDIVNYRNDTLRRKSHEVQERQMFRSIASRDFYMPSLHTFVLLNVLYWGGGMPVIIYSNDMILKSTGKSNPEAKTIMDCLLFIGYNVTTILVRYCSSKKVMLFSMCTSSIFMASAAVVTYLQCIGILPKDSEFAVYSLIGFVTFLSLGSCSIGFSISSEIMPVKHRGIGGCLYIILTCVLHSLSLKAYPYLCEYIKIYGVFFIYAFYKILSILFIWRYVPNTRNKTLYELEHFYKYGDFQNNKTNEDESVSVPFVRSVKD